MSRAVETVSRRAVIRASNTASEMLDKMVVTVVEQTKEIEKIGLVALNTHRFASAAVKVANDAADCHSVFSAKTDTLWHRLRWLITGR